MVVCAADTSYSLPGPHSHTTRLALAAGCVLDAHFCSSDPRNRHSSSILIHRSDSRLPQVVFWASGSKAVLGRRQRRLGCLLLSELVVPITDEAAVPALLQASDDDVQAFSVQGSGIGDWGRGRSYFSVKRKNLRVRDLEMGHQSAIWAVQSHVKLQCRRSIAGLSGAGCRAQGSGLRAQGWVQIQGQGQVSG